MLKFLYFDVGSTLVDESAAWEKRCLTQAQTEEAKALGLTAEDIHQAIADASRAYQPQYRTVVKRYGFREVAPYPSELETLYPECKDVLECLSKSYRLGIIANQVDGLRDRLEALGILRFFEVIISSWDYQVMKPDLKLFEIGIEKAGCAPGEIAMIGDRLDNDIFPAKALGMQTIWIRQGYGGMQEPKSEVYQPDHTILSLGELIKWAAPSL